LLCLLAFFKILCLTVGNTACPITLYYWTEILSEKG
jgi:hypothetical protein